MSDTHRIFGAELSPYSVKVRSWFRYKGIPHEWVPRNMETEDEFRRLAKLPLVPLVVLPDGKVMQDSTPIIDALEPLYPEPSIHPGEAAAAFLSALLEELGDEWGNKWMFHYRWAREVDRKSAADRIAKGMMPGADEATVENMATAIRERMVDRVGFVGSNETTAPIIEDSYREAIAILDAHLESRPYLFGGRPAFADFGLGPQLQQALSDPTAGEIMRSDAPRVAAWAERMLSPRSEGPFEAWAALEPTLRPFLETQAARLFLPWSDANAKAIERGDASMAVLLDGRRWEQAPQKYHAKSLRALRDRYAAIPDKSALDPILEATGCWRWIAH